MGMNMMTKAKTKKVRGKYAWGNFGLKNWSVFHEYSEQLEELFDKGLDDALKMASGYKANAWIVGTDIVVELPLGMDDGAGVEWRISLNKILLGALKSFEDEDVDEAKELVKVLNKWAAKIEERFKEH